MLIAYDWWKPSEFPFLDEAFLFSFVLTLVMTFGALWYGKKRPLGTPFSWGESIVRFLPGGPQGRPELHAELLT